MSFLEQYFRELRDIHATGAALKEVSYYAPLANLLNAIGSTLKPKVRCLMQLKNLGAGMPDGGFFTARQFQRESSDRPNDPQNPERGVMGYFQLGFYGTNKEQRIIILIGKHRLGRCMFLW